MSIEADLIWRISCESCGRTETQTVHATWFNNNISNLSEEEISGQDFIEALEFDGWEFRRESYEDLDPYCPTCKGK